MCPIYQLGIPQIHHLRPGDSFHGESNLGFLLHFRQILYILSRQGSPFKFYTLLLSSFYREGNQGLEMLSDLFAQGHTSLKEWGWDLNTDHFC